METIQPMASDAEAISGCSSARHATIQEHMARVHAIAKRLRFRLPASVTLDDLISAGMIGLIQAVDRYEPSRNLQFSTYAQYRIRGAMLDFLRCEDPLSRGDRNRFRGTGGSGPLTISLDHLPSRDLRELSTRTAVSALVDRADMQNARKCLSKREDYVMTLIYDLDARKNDVARTLGVSESRVFQINNAALAKLRTRLAPSVV
jgi:RNA polymerase sigma factor (sigma-70 family)